MENNDEQISLDMLEKEIQRELNMPEGYGVVEPIYDDDKVSRKPYRIKDFDSPRDKEMAVFTHAKKLSEYIFVVTEKSPKKLRWSIVTKLQNSSVELVENLYRANYEREEAARLNYMRSSAVNLRLIDFYTETARKMQAINIRQMSIIARQIYETEKLLNGWVRSTKRK